MVKPKKTHPQKPQRPQSHKARLENNKTIITNPKNANLGNLTINNY
jgi:hypothetical protein